MEKIHRAILGVFAGRCQLNVRSIVDKHVVDAIQLKAPDDIQLLIKEQMCASIAKKIINDSDKITYTAEQGVSTDHNLTLTIKTFLFSEEQLVKLIDLAYDHGVNSANIQDNDHISFEKLKLLAKTMGYKLVKLSNHTLC